jgi:hypothetical protein
MALSRRSGLTTLPIFPRRSSHRCQPEAARCTPHSALGSPQRIPQPLIAEGGLALSVTPYPLRWPVRPHPVRHRVGRRHRHVNTATIAHQLLVGYLGWYGPSSSASSSADRQLLSAATMACFQSRDNYRAAFRGHSSRKDRRPIALKLHQLRDHAAYRRADHLDGGVTLVALDALSAMISTSESARGTWKAFPEGSTTRLTVSAPRAQGRGALLNINDSNHHAIQPADQEIPQAPAQASPCQRASSQAYRRSGDHRDTAPAQTIGVVESGP